MSRKSVTRWGYFNYNTLFGVEWTRRDAWKKVRELINWRSDYEMRQFMRVRKVTVTWEEA